MAVSVANPSTGGVVVTPGGQVDTSAPPTGGSATGGTSGVSIPTGLPGPPGKSAYEVAVEEGFTGTEDEWLAELEGDPGDPGPSGPPGPPGPAGEPDVPSLTLIFENGLI